MDDFVKLHQTANNCQLPKIFVFSNVVGGGYGPAYAIAEDGTFLGTHLCSNEHWAIHDLGVSSERHHEEYKKHYPEGYEMEFVHSSKIDSHPGLTTAFELNQKDKIMNYSESQDDDFITKFEKDFQIAFDTMTYVFEDLASSPTYCSEMYISESYKNNLREVRTKMLEIKELLEL